MTFDVLRLDELLTETATDDVGIWEELIALPGGGEAWASAVERRRRIDDLAGRSSGRPFVAQAMLTFRRIARKLGTVRLAATEAEILPAFGATLATPSARRVALAWGTEQILTLS